MLLTNNHGFKVYLEQISELVTKFNYTLSLETNFTSRTSLFPLLPGKMTVISNFSLGWQLSVTLYLTEARIWSVTNQIMSTHFYPGFVSWLVKLAPVTEISWHQHPSHHHHHLDHQQQHLSIKISKYIDLKSKS